MRIASLITLLFMLAAPATAQHRGDAGVDHDRGVDHDLDVFVQDAVDILSAPADFSATDWLHSGMVLAAGLAAWSVDEEVRGWTQERRTAAADDWLRVGDYYGGGVTGGLLGIGLFGGGWAAGDEWTRVTGRMILQSQFYSTFVTHLLKTVLGRARPFRNEGKNSFLFFRIDNAYWAHPSGHATSAFALSSTLSRRVGNLPFSVLLY
ncbi:MAG: hypothetical protein RRA94_13515, partial [Bacteroidota bacterium]|nr:hypothetical protein [Bacteroidota bacterium]